MRLVPYWRNWHRLHSVRFSAIALGCAGALEAYNHALTIAPNVVSSVPHWILTTLVAGTMVAPLGAAIGSMIDQPDASGATPSPPASNDFHQRDGA